MIPGLDSQIVEAGGLGPQHIDHKVSFRPWKRHAVSGKLATVVVTIADDPEQSTVMLGLYGGFEFYSLDIDAKVTVYG